MKKQILLSLGIILGIIFVSAGIIMSANNTNAELSKECNTWYKNNNFDDIKTSDCIPISLDKCEFKIWDEDYNLGTHKISTRYCSEYEEENMITEQTCYNQTYLDERDEPYIDEFCEDNEIWDGKDLECLTYVDYTTQEIETAVNKKVNEKLEVYCQNEIKREIVFNINVKTLGGTVTVSEKK